MELLDQIDRLVDGLCPCGAQPRAGSGYCSYDCEPNHVAVHTDRRETGDYATPMRWRPDLVSEIDDTRLGLIHRFQHGQYNASVYEITGTDGVHCRLDDGNRFVGLDTDGYQFASEDGLHPVWARLERELADSRRTEPEDPWAGAFSNATGQVYIAPAGSVSSDTSAWRVIGTVLADRVIGDAEYSTPTGGVASFHVGGRTTPWDSTASNPLRDMQQLWREWAAQPLVHQPYVDRTVRPVPLAEEISTSTDEPRHPMLAAIEARRNRNTGPRQTRRAPRQINPRRGG